MLNDLEKKTPSVPVTPVPAATVMVLRDTPNGIEVLINNILIKYHIVYLILLLYNKGLVNLNNLIFIF